MDILNKLSGKIIANSSQTNENSTVELGEGFMWDHQKSILSKEGVPIELTRYELILLQLFIEKSELICTTEEMLYYFDEHQIEMSEKNIRNLISKLRKKLPSDLISNIYGMGYKLTLKTKA
jgi:DNA-binding response OmpR family regulator